jgi:hypothetical protein
MALWGHGLYVLMLLIYLPFPVCATLGALGLILHYRELTRDCDAWEKIKHIWAGALALVASPFLWWFLAKYIEEWIRCSS